MKFVVYEVWTRARVIEAKDQHDAYDVGEPVPQADMSLCNWHVVPVDGAPLEEDGEAVGGLNYRQIVK